MEAARVHGEFEDLGLVDEMWAILLLLWRWAKDEGQAARGSWCTFRIAIRKNRIAVLELGVLLIGASLVITRPSCRVIYKVNKH